MTDSLDIAWLESWQDRSHTGDYVVEHWTPRGDGTYDVEVRRCGEATVLRRYVADDPPFTTVYDKTAEMVGDRKL